MHTNTFVKIPSCAVSNNNLRNNCKNPQGLKFEADSIIHIERRGLDALVKDVISIT